LGEPHTDGTRRILVPDFPYWLVYRHSPRVVRILACAHARRRGDYWRRRE
jgi:hypothetical protein